MDELAMSTVVRLLCLLLFYNAVSTTAHASLLTTIKHSIVQSENSEPSESTQAPSDAFSKVYFHQKFSSNGSQPQLVNTKVNSNANLTSSETQNYGWGEPSSFSTNIDHSDNDRDEDDDGPSGISKRQVHYPPVPMDVINRGDDDDRPANGRARILFQILDLN